MSSIISQDVPTPEPNVWVKLDSRTVSYWWACCPLAGRDEKTTQAVIWCIFYWCWVDPEPDPVHSLNMHFLFKTLTKSPFRDSEKFFLDVAHAGSQHRNKVLVLQLLSKTISVRVPPNRHRILNPPFVPWRCAEINPSISSKRSTCRVTSNWT